MPETWPIDILEPEKTNWSRAGGSVNGGANLSGWSQTGTFGGGGFWVLQMTRVLVVEVEQHLAMRWMEAELDQGANPINIAIPDYAAFEELYSGTANIVAVGSAALRASALRLDVVAGPILRRGMIFSVLDDQGLPRRHEIKTVTLVIGQPTQYDVTFVPPLRAAVGSGAVANFSEPACVMKIANIESISGDFIAARFGEVSPVFVEFFGTI